MTKANELTASAAQAAIRAGDLTSRQLIDACLDHTQQRDDDVGAWIYLNPEMARTAVLVIFWHADFMHLDCH